MAIYAIGDLQGCYDDLINLLDKINFNSQNDQLWFVGDLVNRGPDSLKTLRFVKELGSSAQTVLGNHDLHLLATYHGIKRNKDAGVQDILNASDCDELMRWLRNQPLLHHDTEKKYTLVHAGVYPYWNLQQAQEYAHELETVLSSDGYLEFLDNMYGDKPKRWKDTLTDWDRLRFICNSFTRMRYCTPKGKLDFKFNGVPGSQKKKLVPWFEIKDRAMMNDRIIFGHWSTLGYYQDMPGFTLPANIFATDTGCVWGGKLTALKITNTTELISVDCPERTKIK